MEMKIPAELANAIAEYLSTRPWREVAGMMAALQQLKPLDTKERSEG